MQTRPGNVNNILCGLHSVPMCATNASPTFEWRRNMLNSCRRAIHQTKSAIFTLLQHWKIHSTFTTSTEVDWESGTNILNNA